MIPAGVVPGSGLLTKARWFSAAEFIAGALVVIGHNVYRVLPNEVPILFLAGLVSLRLRDGWPRLGLGRPVSWTRTILIALAAAALRILLGDLVIEPLTAHFWPPIAGPAGSDAITGNVKLMLTTLGLVWTFAAFGEEIGYRGYLLARAADAAGRTKAAYVVGLILVSVLFGYGHYYKGPAGVLDSGIAGLILGVVYLWNKRNLWTAVLAHGFIDTYGLIAVFLGWAS